MSDPIEFDPSGLEKKKRDPKYLRRAAAGVAEMINLPAIYALPGNLGGEDWELPGHSYASSAADKIQQGIYDTFDIDAPQTTDELAAHLISALSPAAATSIAKIPQVAKAGTFVRGAAKTADVLLNPGVQGKYTPVTAGANFGIPFAAGEGVREFSEGKDQGSVKTVYDQLTGEKTKLPSATEIETSAEPFSVDQAQLPLMLDPKEVDLHIVDEDAKKDNEESWLGGAATNLALIAGSLVLGRTLHGALKERIAKQGSTPTLDADPSSYEPLTVGKQSQNDSTAVGRLKGSIFDENEIIADVIERSSGKEAAQTFRTQAQLGNHIGVAAKTEELFATGRWPLTLNRVSDVPNIKTQPLKDLQIITDQLDDVKKQQLNDYMQIMREFDDLKLLGGLKGTQKTLLKGKTVNELKAIKQSIESDKTIPALARMYNEVSRSFVKYAEYSGLIDNATANKFIRSRPNYTFRQQLEVPRVTDLLFKSAKNSGDDFDSIPFREVKEVDLKERGTDFTGTFRPPTTVFKDEMRKLIRVSEMNQYRKSFFQSIIDPATGKSKLRGVREVSGLKRGADNIVKYFDHGHARYFKVEDESILRLLKQGGQPKQLNQIENVLNTLRNIKQFGTTGALFNPRFAFISSQIWDPIQAALTLPKGVKLPGVFGGLSGALKGMKASHYERMAENLRVELLQRDLGMEGKPKSFIKKLFDDATAHMPRETVEQLAEGAAHAYAQSPVAVFRMMGVGGSRAFNDYSALASMNITDPASIRKWKEAIFKDNVSPLDYDWTGRKGWMRYWFGSTIDALRNGVKYQIIDKNLPKGYKDLDDMEKYLTDLSMVSKETRDMLDSSKMPSGEGVHGFTIRTLALSHPYLNISIQGFHKLMQAGRRNPERVARVMGGMIMAGFSTALINSLWSKEHSEWFWMNRADYDRGSKLIVPHPTSDDPLDSAEIPLEPMTAIPFLIGQTVADALFGLSNYDTLDPTVARSLADFFGMEDLQGLTALERRGYDIKAAATRLSQLGMMPIAEVGLGLNGMRPTMDGGITPIYGQRVQQYSELYGTTPSKYVNGIINSQVEAVMQGFVGQFATGLVVDMLEGGRMAMGQKPNDYVNMFGDMKDVYTAHTFNTGKLPIKTFTTEARLLNEYDSAYESVLAKWTDAQRMGMTKQNNGAPLPGVVPPGFKDQQQLAMFEFIKPKFDQIKRAYVSSPYGISAMKAFRDSINSDGRLELDERKQKVTEYNSRIQALQVERLRAIEALEDEVAKQLGIPEFDLRQWADDNFQLDGN